MCCENSFDGEALNCCYQKNSSVWEVTDFLTNFVLIRFSIMFNTFYFILKKYYVSAYCFWGKCLLHSISVYKDAIYHEPFVNNRIQSTGTNTFIKFTSREGIN